MHLWFVFGLVAVTSAIAMPAMASSGNKAHDMLTALPAGQRAAALGYVVGEGCRGKTAFFMGMEEDKSALWSVACVNGKSYAVMLDPDARGTTIVLECNVLRIIAGTDCFKKLE